MTTSPKHASPDRRGYIKRKIFVKKKKSLKVLKLFDFGGAGLQNPVFKYDQGEH